MAAFPDGPILAIDASTIRGSVAVVRGADVLAERTVAMRAAGSEPLLPAIAEALAESRLSSSELAGVVAGEGPGSFTGLRIAAATAKGLSLAHDLPLFAMPTLPLVVAATRLASPLAADARSFLVLLDAMRGECFASRVDVDERGFVRSWEPSRLLPRAAAVALADKTSLVAIGPGEPMEAWPHASGIVRFSAEAPHALSRVDVASWEPNYGRLAEAQVRWEAAHGRPLGAADGRVG